MIEFEHHTLANGLQVILAPQPNRPMVAVNLLYRVGSKHDPPQRSGFAHLFEHLMFAGSEQVDNFDEQLQRAGGENNAYTTSDYTIYQDLLPAENLDTALWLESDRMRRLNFSKKVLATQKRVVVEEFKETCLEEPYGDLSHHLYALAYQKHPYRWPVIGENFSQIEATQLQEVQDFFYRYYRPNNAILCLCGSFKADHALERVRYYFDDIQAGPLNLDQFPKEPPQLTHRQKVVYGDVPSPAIYLAYRAVDRMHPDYHALAVLTYLLGGGRSALLTKKLVRDQEVFHALDASLSNSFDPGLLLITGVPNEDLALPEAREALLTTIDQIIQEGIPKSSLQKVIHKLEIGNYYSDINLDSRAEELCFYAALGKPAMINEEFARYQAVSVEDVNRCAREYLRLERCSELQYLPEQAE